VIGNVVAKMEAQNSMQKAQLAREKKGVRIAVSGGSIQKLSKNQYRVKSQTRDVWYDVTKTPDADVWACSCPDFCYNLTRKEDKRCKHIRAVQVLQATLDRELHIEKLDVPKICPQCNSTEIVKNGLRVVQHNVRRQKYRCNQCYYRFSFHESGFSGMRFSPKIITETLNLYMSGMSYRKISRHIKSVHDVKVSHVSVYEWFVKYTEVIRDYVNSVVPATGEIWSLDEMMVNVKDTQKMGKGFYDWLWTIIDPKTRFVIATEVSKRRETKDARAIIAKGKAVSRPNYVITDSLRTYEDAIRKELDSRKTAHIKTESLSDGFQNRPIERYHNEIRETLKARRGLGNDESTQRYADAYKDYHNFVRPHAGLSDRTPAEAAGIDLGLGHDKIKDLITKGSETKNNFAAQLGKRAEKVNISNEKDCIKVYCKGWVEKQTWREINDILRINGFVWLSNGKDSCWIRMQA
jgi:transposase-like protein/predicted nucleic acid-binding Zn finger protein